MLNGPPPMIVGSIARRYAKALFDLAVEQGKLHYVRRADALLAEIGPGPTQAQALQ